MPVRLKELTGKLGWMKWEPLPLFSEGRRSREGSVKWSEEAEANKGAKEKVGGVRWKQHLLILSLIHI